MYRINLIPKTTRASQSDRLTLLLHLGEIVFHTGDFANLWQIQNRNTLYTTLKRYTRKGILHKIYKGLYALKPLKELDPRLLGIKALHRFAYVSTETVLAEQGILAQQISTTTLISDIAKQFSIGPYQYLCRKIPDRYLYNPAGLADRDGIKIAIRERAVADLLYINPRAYLDGSRLVDWRKVSSLKKIIGYPLAPKNYVTTKSPRRHP